MSNVVPTTHMQYARRVRREARRFGASEVEIRATIRAGLPLLADRTPESVSYEQTRRFRSAVPTGSTAA